MCCFGGRFKLHTKTDFQIKQCLQLAIHPPALRRGLSCLTLVMVYWHVERNSACIYSQLKSCSSSEVAAMIEGVLRHCTDMEVEKNYVDTRGQSEVGFAFCHLLGFQLLPRLKGIGRQRLYRPEKGNPYAYPNLQLILTRPINWELIQKYYDEMIKYATALRLGTAEADAILQRFTRNQPQHPIYSALAELGKVVKTIFLCHYLASEEEKYMRDSM
jgi:TnpA family transposase